MKDGHTERADKLIIVCGKGWAIDWVEEGAKGMEREEKKMCVYCRWQ